MCVELQGKYNCWPLQRMSLYSVKQVMTMTLMMMVEMLIYVSSELHAEHSDKYFSNRK